MGQKSKNLFEMGADLGTGWSEVVEVKKEQKRVKPKEAHRLHIAFEKRRGKPNTLVGLFSYEEEALKVLHKKIKKALACGGSIEGAYLLFQGDHRGQIKALFEKEGWRFK